MALIFLGPSSLVIKCPHERDALGMKRELVLVQLDVLFLTSLQELVKMMIVLFQCFPGYVDIISNANHTWQVIHCLEKHLLVNL